MRCVGSAISKIQFKGRAIEIQHIDYEYDKERNLFTYINKYCADNLKELTIAPTRIAPNGKQYLIDFLRYFDHDFFFANSVLERLFPALQELNCTTRQNASFYDMNTNHLPCLEKLKIDYGYFERDGDGSVENKMVQEFLRLNPQLKELTISSRVNWENFSRRLDITLIWNAVDSLQNVEKLKLSEFKSTQERDNIIHMKSVKSFEIMIKNYYPSIELSSTLLPFQFDQLEKFYLDFPFKRFYPFFVDEFYEFIERHPTITHLC